MFEGVFVSDLSHHVLLWSLKGRPCVWPPGGAGGLREAPAARWEAEQEARPEGGGRGRGGGEQEEVVELRRPRPAGRSSAIGRRLLPADLLTSWPAAMTVLFSL